VPELWEERRHGKTDRRQSAGRRRTDVLVRPTPPQQGPRVLVVEDDRAALTGLSELLDALGYAVEACGDFERARQRLLEHRFDAVVSDVRLRGYNGFHLLHIARDQSPDARLIAVSGFEDATLQDEASQLSAVMLLKPIDLAQFVNALPPIGQSSTTDS
jgi:two-component system response regulator PilR (NtrC family)